MTPTIKDAIALGFPKAEQFAWFDVGGMPSQLWFDQTEQMGNLPFQYTAIAGRTAKGDLFALACFAKTEGHIGVGGLARESNGTKKILAPFWIVDVSDGVEFHVVDADGGFATREHCSQFAAVIRYFLRSLEQGHRAHRLVVPDTFVNRKRKAKGKAPLNVSWHTVVIEPTAPRRESQGGTHASPRRHDRRGHWRQLKSGRRVWVRQAVVGNASRGIVMKDYLVRTMQ